jgi:hypothetical protein
MKNIIRTSLVVVLGLVASAAYSGKASSDLSGMEEGTRALVSKERARQMMFKSDGEKRQSDGDKSMSMDRPANGPKGLDDKQAIVKSGGVTGGCNIDIGNSDSSRPGSGSSKPKPVIITGPVVQLCK